MARISNIEQVLGGANNVFNLEVIRGEQLNFEGLVKGPDADGMTGDPIDITSYTITALAEFYTATVMVTPATARSSGSVTISNITESTKADRTLTVTKDADPTTGKFTVVIPDDLASDDDTAMIDSQENVLLAILFITYNTGGSNPVIRRSRGILTVRHGG